MSSGPDSTTLLLDLRREGGFAPDVPDSLLQTALQYAGGNIAHAKLLGWDMLTCQKDGRSSTVRPDKPPTVVDTAANVQFVPMSSNSSAVFSGVMPTRVPIPAAAMSKVPLGPVTSIDDVIDLVDTPTRASNKIEDVVVDCINDNNNDDGVEYIDFQPSPLAVDSLRSPPASSPPVVPDWPKRIRPFLVTASCSVRGDFFNLHTTPLHFWLEGKSVLPSAKKSAPGKASRAKKLSEYDSSYLDLDEIAEIRFGFMSRVSPFPIALGRLPPAVAKFLVPLLEESMITVTGNVMYADSPRLNIGNTLVLSIGVAIHKNARKLMRVTASSLAPEEAGEDGRALKDSPKYLRLRSAIFELFYYSSHGDFSPKPQKQAASKAAAATTVSAGSVAAPSPSVDAAQVEAGTDNTEDRVGEEQIKTLVSEEVAPKLPLAEQPAALRNITMRPYQRQALAWLIARETGSAPVGTEADIPVTDSAAVPDAEARAPVNKDAENTLAAQKLVEEALDKGTGSASMATTASVWENFVFTDGTPVYLNVYTRVVSLSTPPETKPCKGGILADEMGLGKTAEFCSLVLARRIVATPLSGSKRKAVNDTSSVPTTRKRTRRSADDDERSVPVSPDPDVATTPLNEGKYSPDADDESSSVDPDLDEETRLPSVRATLVVCPMSMMGQWKREAEKYTASDNLVSGETPFKVVIHYGTNRLRSMRQIEQYDMVVTSFGVLASEFDDLQAYVETDQAEGKQPPVLFSVCWNRVALDEAHTIRNRTTKIARACFELDAQHRWALTGTPIQNSLQDLYSLLRFLRHEPWSELLWWKRVISEPFAKGEPKAIAALQSVLHPLLLRRTKQMRDVDGSKIGDLAPADIRIIPVTLSLEERNFYDQLYKRSKLRFQGFVASGSVLSHFAQIFTLLLRLRQSCLHPYLVIAGLRVAQLAGPGAPTQAVDGVTFPAETGEGPDETIGVIGPVGSPAEPPTPQPAGADTTETVPDLYSFSDEFLNELYLQFLNRAGSAGGQQNTGFLGAQLGALREKGVKDEECPICLDTLVSAKTSVLACGHILCTACSSKLSAGSACPVCRQPVSDEGLPGLNPKGPAVQSHLAPNKTPMLGFNFQSISRDSLLADDSKMPWRKSSKLELLISELQSIKQHNAAAQKAAKTIAAVEVQPSPVDAETELGEMIAGMYLEGPVRVVVFSSFTFMLDLIEKCCKTEKLGYARLDGSMSQPQREASLKAFRSDPSTFVMLISLKAGGLGLNLTEASVVYLMDPWWNPSQEHQALSRVHRLGQQKQVYIKRLIAVDTIEEAMLEIQNRKQQIAKSALNPSAAMQASKLSEEELRMFFRR